MTPTPPPRSAALRVTLSALALTGAFTIGYLARPPHQVHAQSPTAATSAATGTNRSSSPSADEIETAAPSSSATTLAKRYERATTLIRKNHEKFAEFNFGRDLVASAGMMNYFELTMSERAELERIIAETKAAMEQREVEIATASTLGETKHIRHLPADAEFAAATKKRFMEQLHGIIGSDSLELLRYASDEYFDPFKGPRRVTCTVTTSVDNQPNYGIEIYKLDVSGKEIGSISITDCRVFGKSDSPVAYAHLFRDL
jgi:hypothetical protein